MSLESQLSILESFDLIRLAQVEPELEYLFRHALIQEAAYESMLHEDRKRLHLTIGETIERLFPERRDEYAPLLSHHFFKSESYDKALKYSKIAAEKAIQQYSNQEAIVQLTNGIRALEKMPKRRRLDRVGAMLLTMLGSAYLATRGEGSELVYEAFSRALEICERNEMYARAFPVQIGLTAYYFARARVAEARRMAEETVEFSSQHPIPYAVSWSNWALGHCLYQGGELLASRETLVRAAYSPELPNVVAAVYDIRVSCLGTLAHVLGLLGHFDQSMDVLQKGLKLAREISQPFSLANIYWNSLFVYWARGDLPATRQLAVKLIDYSEEYGFDHRHTVGKMFHGWVLAKQGDVDRGIRQIVMGLQETKESQTIMFRSYYLSLLTEVYIGAGRFSEGLKVVDRTISFMNQSGERFYEAEVYRLKGELLEALDNNEGEAWFRKAIEVAAHQGARLLELRATMSLCRLLERQGKREIARQRLAGIFNWFAEGFDTADMQAAERLLSALKE